MNTVMVASYKSEGLTTLVRTMKVTPGKCFPEYKFLLIIWSSQNH
jgi:hypothetical protein